DVPCAFRLLYCSSEVCRTAIPCSHGPRPPTEGSPTRTWRGGSRWCAGGGLSHRPGHVPGGRSALALLVAQVVADHHDATVPADRLALVADLLDARLDLHRISSTAPVPVSRCARGSVVGGRSCGDVTSGQAAVT